MAIKQNDRYTNAKELLQELGEWKPVQLQRTVVPDIATENSSKAVFGEHSPIDKTAARETIKKAIELSKEPGKLPLATDILEEVINKDPNLRQQYGSQLKLWRRGISM